MELSPTAKKAINTYGGVDLWQKSKNIEAEVSVRGLAFTLKGRTFFNHARIKMDIGRPFSKITPIGKHKHISGILDGNTVLLERDDGTIIGKRENPRKYFPYGKRLFYWDDLDMAYFANYAFWNYFTLPRLLMNEYINWKEKEEALLEATFPDNFPTHSRIQEFRFDKNSGLLKQHNYTADIISKLATAANVILEHKAFNGITVASSRKVTPRNKKGIALSGPTLIDIKIHNFRLNGP